MATYYLRGDTYYSNLRCKGHPKADNSGRIRIPLSKDENTSKVMLAEIIKEVDGYRKVPRLSAANLAGVDLTWHEFFHLATSKRKADQEEGTSYADEHALRWAQGLIPVRRLSEITPDYLKRVLGSAVDSGWVKMNGKIAVENGQAANRYVRAVKAVMRWAELELKLAPQNWKIPRPLTVPNKGRRIEWYEPEDMQWLRLACGEPSHETVLMLGSLAGLRPGEMRMLWWENVDFSRNLIQVTGKEWTEKDGTHMIWRPKAEDFKGAGADRSIEMMPDLREYLLELKKHAKGKWAVAQITGEPLQKDSLIQAWSRMTQRAAKLAQEAGKELKVFGPPYLLRHTFAVEFMRSGGNIYDLQHIMGHASVTTTEIYAKFAPKRVGGPVLTAPPMAPRRVVLPEAVN